MRRFYVEVREELFDLLRDWAVVDRRAIREQAAVVLEAAIRSQRLPDLTPSRPEHELRTNDRAS